MNCARDEVGIGDLDGCAAERLGLAYLIITHRLPEVRHVSDRLAIMYLGRCVEQGHTVRCHFPLGCAEWVRPPIRGAGQIGPP